MKLKGKRLIESIVAAGYTDIISHMLKIRIYDHNRKFIGMPFNKVTKELMIESMTDFLENRCKGIYKLGVNNAT